MIAPPPPAPKLMNTGDLADPGIGGCPSGGTQLTQAATGGAFLDGCYMNTTRIEKRREDMGHEAQNYLYMWKHVCAYTRWIPSNQFMYSGLDYDDSTMTLERFGFIGIDRKCFWGSIGVIWKRPLPVEQILPNATQTIQPPKPEPKPKPKPKPKPTPLPEKAKIAPLRLGAYEVQSRINPGNDIQYMGAKGYTFKPRIENALNQHWWLTEVVPKEVFVI